MKKTTIQNQVVDLPLPLLHQIRIRRGGVVVGCQGRGRRRRGVERRFGDFAFFEAAAEKLEGVVVVGVEEEPSSGS
ncbi:hypothetical protein Q3G72_003083 [Acer saccharum]|nr:hypothetical protein Q3G72_003083 [Acer saccharum]